jgi:hypothetical protein
MIFLPASVNAWGSDRFAEVLQRELGAMDASRLPLQQGMTAGSLALDTRVSVMILRVEDDADHIHVRAGIFYTGIIAGCSCADDPSPVDEHSEYCEVQLAIDKATAGTALTLLD